MVRIYGKSFTRNDQINRLLRRGTDGLIAGRSEAAAPVTLKRSRLGGSGPVGTAGPAGRSIAVDLALDNHHMWGSAGTRTWDGLPSATDTFNARTVVTHGVVTAWPGLASGGDLASVPYYIVTDDPTDGFHAALSSLTSPTAQMGQGNGRGGFLYVAQFGVRTSVPAGVRWLAGLWSGVSPFTAQSLIGVGANTAGAAPSFIHSGVFAGGSTQVSTGMPNLTINTVYEVRIFADPRRTDARIRFERFSHGRSVAVANYTASANLPIDTMVTGIVMLTSPSTGAVHLAVRYLFMSIQPIGMTIDS